MKWSFIKKFMVMLANAAYDQGYITEKARDQIIEIINTRDGIK